MLVTKANQVFFRPFKRLSVSTLAVVMVFLMAIASGVGVPNAQAAKSSSVSVVEVAVNINKANSEQIAEALSGVGIKKAEAIVAYRSAHGKFKNIDDLLNVKGIGRSTLKKNRSLIKI